MVGSEEVQELLEPALSALYAATSAALSLLDGLTLADPIRGMYWLQNKRELQKLQAKASAFSPENDLDAMQS